MGRSEGGVHWERGISPPRLRVFSWNWRGGIGARLGVAFAAVAGLAVAANLLIEKETSITRKTRTVRIATPSPLPMAFASRSPNTASLAQAETVSPKALIAAIEHCEVAVRSRLDVHNDHSVYRD